MDKEHEFGRLCSIGNSKNAGNKAWHEQDLAFYCSFYDLKKLKKGTKSQF